MARQEDNKRRRLAFGAAALATGALLVAWALGSAGPASAEPHPGVNYNMSVGGFSGCNTSQGDAQCYIPPGTAFTLSVTLEPLPSDVPSYEGFDVTLEYTGLTSADNANVEHWPDCGFPVTSFEPGTILVGCAIGVEPAPASTYVGLMVTNDFTCSQSGSIRMPHGYGSTDLLQNVALPLSEPGDAETLNITCGAAPTATPLPTLVGTGSGGAFNQSDADGTGLWLAVGALLALTGGAAVLSWTFARNRP